ncbi:MAG: MotA/TolQ/ExbB proton channel family protein [Crocinitomicaceae bacterium]|jgi:biopolymer transport protein ExbB|nr:MotA/TolQ/ExbB proton channel family protein [Crocinitomicaceae bacterium]MDA9881638.1 MotA/TolQ/ExbB proton channel family protein [Crocinitomicaceae bacterium]MDG1036489.1 MotA/TolQ/ExbB proton channel family protein [Crocinitomicaceae bacterium]MDG1742887.1 MotA/TolQ/ExbB proton channel family protein [Crocinitomicaceae bacterium]
MSLSFLLQIETGVTTDTGVNEIPVWDILKDSSQTGFGLIINILLALMLGYAIFIFVERFLALRKASKEDKGFLQKIKDYILDGKIDSAKDYCSRSNSPSARMLEKGISRLGKPIENITATIENTGKLEILRLEQRLSFLATAAGAAPMIGFLGTTVGMIMVFIDLGNATSLELKVIAPGIMTAMVTTVEGLIVGIISYVGYNFLVAKIEKVVYQMENDALEFTDLLHEPGK